MIAIWSTNVKRIAPSNGMLENSPKEKSDSFSERSASTLPIWLKHRTVNTMVCHEVWPVFIAHA